MDLKLKTLLIIFSMSFYLNAQKLNTEINNADESPYLVGKIDKSGLKSANYSSWFNENYDTYNPNSTLIAQISPILKQLEIKVFMGTWCGDSKREVPRLYKILDACNFPMAQLTTVALSNESHLYKQSPQHEEAGLNIHRVPTILFLKNGNEINRIVEYPVKTLEEDILKIVTNNDYKSNYYIVTEIDNILQKKGVQGLLSKKEQLLEEYKDKVFDISELDTYSRILFEANRIDHALAVLELNTQLIPYDSYTFLNYSNALQNHGHKEKAKMILKKGLVKHPNDEDLKQSLNNLESN